MVKETKLWRDEDDEYFQHISRVIRIEHAKKLFKDCIDEIIYLQKRINKLEENPKIVLEDFRRMF